MKCQVNQATTIYAVNIYDVNTRRVVDMRINGYAYDHCQNVIRKIMRQLSSDVDILSAIEPAEVINYTLGELVITRGKSADRYYTLFQCFRLAIGRMIKQYKRRNKNIPMYKTTGRKDSVKILDKISLDREYKILIKWIMFGYRVDKAAGENKRKSSEYKISMTPLIKRYGSQTSAYRIIGELRQRIINECELLDLNVKLPVHTIGRSEKIHESECHRRARVFKDTLSLTDHQTVNMYRMTQERKDAQLFIEK